MNLSDHLTLVEMTRTSHPVANVPTEDDIWCMQELARNVFEPFRLHCCDGKRVDIDSGFRCSELNRIVGGAKGSQHTRGEALDAVPSAVSIARAMWRLAQGIKDGSLTVDQAIIYPSRGFIHLSHSPHRAQRKELLVSPRSKVYEAYHQPTLEPA